MIPVFARAIAGIVQQRTDSHFDAPKARLAELVFNELFRGSPGVASISVALGAVLVFGIPIFLAWDFAKGAGRRTWVWMTFAALLSWLVLPALWIASAKEDRSANSEGIEP